MTDGKDGKGVEFVELPTAADTPREEQELIDQRGLPQFRSRGFEDEAHQIISGAQPAKPGSNARQRVFRDAAAAARELQIGDERTFSKALRLGVRTRRTLGTILRDRFPNLPIGESYRLYVTVTAPSRDVALANFRSKLWRSGTGRLEFGAMHTGGQDAFMYALAEVGNAIRNPYRNSGNPGAREELQRYTYVASIDPDRIEVGQSEVFELDIETSSTLETDVSFIPEQYIRVRDGERATDLYQLVLGIEGDSSQDREAALQGIGRRFENAIDVVYAVNFNDDGLPPVRCVYVREGTSLTRTDQPLEHSWLWHALTHSAYRRYSEAAQLADDQAAEPAGVPAAEPIASTKWSA